MFGGRSVKILQICQRVWSCKALRTCCRSGGVQHPSEAVVFPQKQTGTQPACSGSACRCSLPEEFPEKVKSILDPSNALFWWPLVSMCLLCWWLWSHLPHWRSTLCLILWDSSRLPTWAPIPPQGAAWTINRALRGLEGSGCSLWFLVHPSL